MGVYRIKLAGRRKPILLRAKSKTEATERVVETIESLTGEEVETALDTGEKVWKVGEELPDDDPAPDGETGSES
jgi:hypothetical protein